MLLENKNAVVAETAQVDALDEPAPFAEKMCAFARKVR